MQAYEGTYSRKFTRNVATGTGALIQFVDVIGIGDLHGIIPGLEYQLSARIYIPSGGILGTEILFQMQDYAAGWIGTDGYAVNTYDEWQELSFSRTIRAAATGFLFQLVAAATAENAELFYVENLRMLPLGVHNEHLQNFLDAGTDTQVG